MKQSRATSFLKSLVSTAAGFGLSLLAQWLVLPWLLGISIPLHSNLAFAAIMTVISVARGYVLERIFEMLGWRVRMSPFVLAVLAERRRQIEVEGWSPEHDDRDHRPGDLARAGACYGIHAGVIKDASIPVYWEWAPDWWKPAGFRRDLVKACALTIAEGEKFDRNKKPARTPGFVARTPDDVPARHKRGAF
jgi:hypothetical protein